MRVSTFAGSRAVADRASQIAAEVPWRFKPEVLAELAKRKLRRKIPQLRDALEGRFRPHHALLVGEMLARIGSALATIDRISAEIDQRMQPFGLVDLLINIPGVSYRTCEVPHRRDRG
jgi:transposase